MFISPLDTKIFKIYLHFKKNVYICAVETQYKLCIKKVVKFNYLKINKMKGFFEYQITVRFGSQFLYFHVTSRSLRDAWRQVRFHCPLGHFYGAFCSAKDKYYNSL